MTAWVRRYTMVLIGFATIFVSQSALATPIPTKPSAFDYQPQSDDERGLWAQVGEMEREIKASKFLIGDADLNGYLKTVLCHAVGKDRCAATRIYLVRTPQFNASMAPNGMLLIWSGLLLRTQNEAELAAVLAHEFNHFEQQHSLQSFRDLKKKTDVLTWMSLAPSADFLTQFSLIGSVFQFSRDMERQADMLSVRDLTSGGYDPLAASEIWQHLRNEMDASAAAKKQRSMKDRDASFFSTHPGTKERMDYLRDAAQKLPVKKRYLGTASYRNAVVKFWPMLIDDQIKTNDFGGTEFLIAQLAAKGWSSELLYARGELYRTRGKTTDFEKAATFYQQAINKHNSLSENWRGLGLSLLRSGKEEEGKAALRTYLKLQPDGGDRDLIEAMLVP
jgi:beta-barrel assembly-enhancing protease